MYLCAGICLLTDLCLNGGVCENIPGSFQCVCADGFEGRLCNEASKTSTTDNYVVPVVSLTAAFVVLLITGIAVGYLVYQKRKQDISIQGND